MAVDPPAAMRHRVGVVADEVFADPRDEGFEADEVLDRVDVLLTADVADDTDLARPPSTGLISRSVARVGEVAADTRRLTLVPVLDTLLTVLAS